VGDPHGFASEAQNNVIVIYGTSGNHIFQLFWVDTEKDRGNVQNALREYFGQRDHGSSPHPVHEVLPVSRDALSSSVRRYFIKGGRTRYTLVDGTTRDVETKNGEAQVLPRVTHSGEQLDDIDEILVELKQ